MLIRLPELLVMVPDVVPSLKTRIIPLTVWLRLIGFGSVFVTSTVTFPPEPMVTVAVALTGCPPAVAPLPVCH
jgi:hypothetical protein